MSSKEFFEKYYFQVMMVVFAIGLIFALPSSQRVGDRLQYMLPVIGLVCSFEADEAGEYLARYTIGLASVHAVKNVSTQFEVGQRPNGGNYGLPSGHTYSATYGASYIVRNCSKRVPYLGPIATIGAAFTGVSRADADKHSAWQVFWGFLWGLAFDVGFRRKSHRERVKKVVDRFRKRPEN